MEKEKYLFHFIKTRKERSKLFIRMGIFSWVYIFLLYITKNFTNIVVSKEIETITLSVFPIISIILFYIAWWHIKNPATYEAIITKTKFIVSYPFSDAWSFDVNISDIKKIENRQIYSSGGKSVMRTGLVMSNNDFHAISINYGNSINKMFKVLNSINSNITFSKEVNTKFKI